MKLRWGWASGLASVAFAVLLLVMLAPEAAAGSTFLRSYEEGELVTEEEHSCCAHALEPSTAVARVGRQSLQVTLRPEDPKWKTFGYRAEYHSQAYHGEGETSWFHVSYFLPVDFDQGDNPNTWNDRLIFQFADEGSPHLSLHLDADRREFFVRRKGPDGSFHYLGRFPATVGVWHDIQMKIRFTQGSDGLIEVWQNGNQVVAYTGRTLAVRTSAYSKWGIYGQPTRLFVDAVARSTDGPIVLPGSSTPDASTPADALPSVSILEPADGAVVSGPVQLRASTADDQGVTQVEFLVDGQSIGVDGDASDGWSAPWDSRTAANGSRVLTARATDTAGQTGSASLTVRVDNSTSTSGLSVASVTYATFGGADEKKHVDVSIRVRSVTGAPVADALVRLRVQVNGVSYFEAAVRTDASGTAVFAMRNAPPGAYTETGSVTHPSLAWDGIWPGSFPSDPFMK